jgi:hypothetical protein
MCYGVGHQADTASECPAGGLLDLSRLFGDLPLGFADA